MCLKPGGDVTDLHEEVGARRPSQTGPRAARVGERLREATKERLREARKESLRPSTAVLPHLRVPGVNFGILHYAYMHYNMSDHLALTSAKKHSSAMASRYVSPRRPSLKVYLELWAEIFVFRCQL